MVDTYLTRARPGLVYIVTAISQQHTSARALNYIHERNVLDARYSKYAAAAILYDSHSRAGEQQARRRRRLREQ